MWLQLPYRYIVPVMVLMVVLHWLTARSLFFVQMTTYDVQGNPVPSVQVDGCIYSPLAIFFAVIVGSVLIIALLGCSLFRLHPGIPVASSCSLAISAAAHANEKDAAIKPLMYGVILPKPSEKRDRAKVGFSCHDVGPLIDGETYSRWGDGDLYT